LAAVAQKHYELCNKFYAERENYKLTKQKGNIKIRSHTNEEGRQVLIIECLIPDMVPDDWLVMMNNMEYYSLKYDKECERMEKLEGAGDKYEAWKMIFRLPSFLTPRYCFLACYPFLNCGDGEHAYVMSVEGLESVFEQNTTADEKAKWIHAQMHHIGYKFIPERNEEGKITGCTYFCVCDYSIGGSFNSVPKWLEYFMGEAGIMQTMENLIAGVRNENMEKLNDEFRKDMGQLNVDFMAKIEAVKEITKKLDQAKRNELFALQK
jgi:hypothetical protein